MVGISRLGAVPAVSAALLVLSPSALAAASPSVSDEAATLTYLHAEAGLEQARLEGLP